MPVEEAFSGNDKGLTKTVLPSVNIVPGPTVLIWILICPPGTADAVREDMELQSFEAPTIKNRVPIITLGNTYTHQSYCRRVDFVPRGSDSVPTEEVDHSRTFSRNLR